MALLALTESALADEAPRRDRFWAEAEALFWQIQGAPQPTPLVTTGRAADAIPGALGQPGTSTVMGGSPITLPFDAGGRFALGGWIDHDDRIGVEAGGFFLAPGTTQQTVATNGSTVLAVPVFDISGYTSGGRPGQSVFILPGSFPGGFVFKGQFEQATSAQMHGAELSVVHSLHDDGRTKLELLAGYRWLQLSETLDFYTQTQGIGPASLGQVSMFHDGFYTNNSFNGAQLGVRTELEYKRFMMRAGLKGALGDMYRQLSIAGSGMTTAGTVFYPVPGGAPFGAGIFAQPSNIGDYGSHALSGVVELGLRLGYRLTDAATFYIGYNALYVGSVLRPGDQVNRNINTTATPLAAASRASGSAIPTGGPAGPTVEMNSSGVWTHGVSAGLTFRF
jgi:hypothetical protein